MTTTTCIFPRNLEEVSNAVKAFQNKYDFFPTSLVCAWSTYWKIFKGNEVYCDIPIEISKYIEEGRIILTGDN